MTPDLSLKLTPVEAAAYLRRNAKQRFSTDKGLSVVFEVPVPGGVQGQGWAMIYAQYPVGIRRRCVLTLRSFPTNRPPTQHDAHWLQEFFAELAVPEGSVMQFAEAAVKTPTDPFALGWDEQLYGTSS